jgi:hypothetical protein
MKRIKRLTAFLLSAAMTCTPILTPVYAVDTDEPAVTEENRQEYIGLSIRSLPDKLYYHIGEALDLTGGRAEAAGTSLSGMKWDIFDAAMDSNYFKLNTSEFDNTKPGTYNIYIYLRGVDDKTAVRADSFEVTVLADGEEAPAPKEVQQTDEMIWLNLEKSPKTLYQVGEALDLTGGTATLCHSSSDRDETKPLTEFHVNSSEFDSNTPGIYNIYVTAKENGTTVTTAFTVTVTDEAPTASAPTETTEETVTEMATTLPPTEAPHEDITFYITKSPDKVTYQINGLNSIDSATRYELLTRLESMPKHFKLLHGDFRPDNILVKEDGTMYLIDWVHATQGNASADVARTYTTLMLENEEAAKKYYEDFCGKTKTDKSYVFKWLPIIAAANLTKQRPEEKELLESWLNISDHM